MKYIKAIILISSISCYSCHSQKNEQKPKLTPEMDPFRLYVHDSLKHLLPILDSVFYSDQKYRDNKLSTLNAHRSEIKAIDSANLLIVSGIIDKYGILGYKDIGIIGGNAIVLTIQHADLATQEKYLPKFRDAIKKKKVLPSFYAMLEDRIAIRNGKMQIYGTQISLKKKENELLPVIEIDSINERRASIGMTETIEVYLKRFGIEWDIENYKNELPRLMKKYNIK